MSSHSKAGVRCAVAALLLLAGACTTVKVSTDYDKTFSFAGHDTFAWVSPHPMVAKSADVSPLAEGRLQRAIVEAMQRNGIRYVSDPADAALLVAFSLGSKEKIVVTPSFYTATYWGHYPWVGSYYNTVDIRQYAVDRLTIDIFDTGREAPVWHGSATKSAGGIGDEQKGEGMARHAVDKILAGFPPQTTTR
jgi:hypothetical protein